MRHDDIPDTADGIGGIDKPDHIYGNSALHFAALNAHAQCAILLLRAKADVNATNHKGQNAVEICTHPELKHLLREIAVHGRKLKVEIISSN